MSYQDKVEHVSGDDGSGDIFKAAGDVNCPESPDRLEAQGHEKLDQAKHRSHPSPGTTDAQLLKEEGAEGPKQPAHAGNVELPGVKE